MILTSVGRAETYNQFSLRNINMVLTKRHWILICVIVLFLVGGTSIYFVLSKQKSRLTNLHPEQTEGESVKQVIIPSSLSAKDIVSQFTFSPDLFYYEWAKSRGDFYSIRGQEILGIQSPNEGFIGMISGTLVEPYSKRDGIKVYGISEEIPIVLVLSVLEYEKPKFAQEDYIEIAIKRKLEDSNLRGAKLKTKVGLPLEIKEEFVSGVDPEDFNPEHFKPDRYQQYLLHSSNFIIYAFGLKEAAKDAMIRVIDRYGVE